MLSFLNIVLNLTKYFRRENKHKQMQCYYYKYIICRLCRREYERDGCEKKTVRRCNSLIENTSERRKNLNKMQIST